MANNSLNSAPRTSKQKLINDSERQRLWHESFRHMISNHVFAFALALIIVLSGLFVSIRWTRLQDIKDFWSIISPLVATYLGYAIGRRSGSDAD